MHSAPLGERSTTSPAAGARRGLDLLRRDRTRERTAAVQQLLFGGVVFLLSLVVVASAYPGDVGLFFLGAIIVFAVTGATLVVPWNRLPLGFLAVVPALDALAVTVMRIAGPTTGVGLLWIFPLLWLAAGFGLWGWIAGTAGVLVMYATSTVIAAAQSSTYALLLLPIVLVACATTSYLTARRAGAQRVLLERQAQIMARTVATTRRQEQELVQILDTVDFGVVRFAADGSVAVTNEAHARLQRALGRGEGTAPLPAFREDGVTGIADADLPLERSVRGESFDDTVVWFGEPTQSRRALSVTSRRVRTEDGSEDGTILVSRDVTAEILALQARDELVASVSHELRTPLTAILGYVDLALDDPRTPAEVRQNLEVAERNAERLLGLVADILSVSRISNGLPTLAIEPQDVDVAEVIAATVESLTPRAEERALTIDTDGVERAIAHVDAHRLRQVLDNLVANAISYNRDGGRVELAATTDGRSTWILVRDTGVGMSDRERAGLFQRYYRGAGRGSGTGLGLAISRDIVREHGGDITVRSTLGRGSTFIVRLPVAAPGEGGR